MFDLRAIIDWLGLVALGLTMVAVGVYSLIAPGWHAREIEETSRYHVNCAPA